MVSLRERIRRRFKPKPKPEPIQKGRPVFKKTEKPSPRGIVAPAKPIQKFVPQRDVRTFVSGGGASRPRQDAPVPTPPPPIKQPSLTAAQATGVEAERMRETARGLTPSQAVALEARRRRSLRIRLPPARPKIDFKKAISKGVDVLGTKALVLSLKLKTRREELIQEKLELIKQKGLKAPFSREGKKIDKQLQNIAVAESLVPFALLPSALKFLVKNPKEIKNIPSGAKQALIKEGKETGRLLLISPSAGFVKIGTEIYTFKGTGKAISLTGKVSGKAITRISPKFKKIKNSEIIIPSKQPGKAISLKISGPVSKIKTSLREQAELAGKQTLAVSAQADRLVNFIKTKRVVRKPIPNEELLKPVTRKLLSKFDEGKISKKQLIDLDNRIRTETRGGGSLLERSFFASPKGKLRISRLGQESKDASLLDILKGDFTFRTQKPQILIFEDIKVQKFPKELKTVEKKLKTGKALTKLETQKLLKFQLKGSGKFKPIGALSKEPEITLSPREIIKKGKVVAVTIINGKRVPIVRATVIKSKPETKKLLKKANEGKIKTSELKKLRKNLRKETGFKSLLSRSPKRKPIVRVKKIGLTTISRSRRGRKPRTGSRPRRTIRPGLPRLPRVPIPPRRPRSPRVPRVPIPPRRPRSPRRLGRISRPSSSTKRGVPRGGRRVEAIKEKEIITISSKKKKKFSKPSKLKQGYQAFGKDRGRSINLNPKKLLSKRHALDRAARAIDNTTSKTLKIVPKGKVKKLGTIRKSEKGYFGRTKNKFREFKIRKRKGIKTPNKFIEKRRFGIDTRGEKRQLSLAKFAKQQGFTRRRKTFKKNKQSKRSRRGRR